MTENGTQQTPGTGERELQETLSDFRSISESPAGLDQELAQTHRQGLIDAAASDQMSPYQSRCTNTALPILRGLQGCNDPPDFIEHLD
jgi:hypothetical protein